MIEQPTTTEKQNPSDPSSTPEPPASSLPPRLQTTAPKWHPFLQAIVERARSELKNKH